MSKFKPYKSKQFSYSIREFPFGKQMRFFINVYVSCNGVYYQCSEKNNIKYPSLSELQAKKRIVKLLKRACLETAAEKKMKDLPIFHDDGYQEELF